MAKNEREVFSQRLKGTSNSRNDREAFSQRLKTVNSNIKKETPATKQEEEKSNPQTFGPRRLKPDRTPGNYYGEYLKPLPVMRTSTDKPAGDAPKPVTKFAVSVPAAKSGGEAYNQSEKEKALSALNQVIETDLANREKMLGTKMPTPTQIFNEDTIKYTVEQAKHGFNSALKNIGATLMDLYTVEMGKPDPTLKFAEANGLIEKGFNEGYSKVLDEQNKNIHKSMRDIYVNNNKAAEEIENKYPNLTETQRAAGKLVGGTAQMVPMVAASALNPYLGKIVFGAQVYGGGLNEALDKNATLVDARYFGGAETLKELAIESVFGGMPFTKGFADDVIKPIINKVLPNAVLKNVAKRTFSILGEGLEEVTAEYLSPYIKRAIYDKNAPTPTAADYGFAFLSGVVGSLLLGAPGDVRTAYQQSKLGPKIDKYNKYIETLPETIRPQKLDKNKTTVDEYRQASNDLYVDVRMNYKAREQEAVASTIDFMKSEIESLNNSDISVEEKTELINGYNSQIESLNDYADDLESQLRQLEEVKKGKADISKLGDVGNNSRFYPTHIDIAAGANSKYGYVSIKQVSDDLYSVTNIDGERVYKSAEQIDKRYVDASEDALAQKTIRAKFGGGAAKFDIKKAGNSTDEESKNTSSVTNNLFKTKNSVDINVNEGIILNKDSENIYGIMDELGLTYDEQSAILRYKSGNSYILNSALRGEEPLTQQQVSLKNRINDALDKFLVYAGKVYRNIGFATKDAFDDFIAEHKKKTVTYPAFTSASKSVDGYEVEDMPYLAHYEIESVFGHDVSSLGITKEQEILFKTDTSFEIINIIRSGNQVKLFLRERVEDGKNKIERFVENRGEQSKVEVDGTEIEHKGVFEGLYSTSDSVRGGSTVYDEIYRGASRGDRGRVERNGESDNKGSLRKTGDASLREGKISGLENELNFARENATNGIEENENDSRKMKLAKRVMRALNERYGINFRIYSGSEDSFVNGFYENGTVYINQNAKSPILSVIGHEFLHGFKDIDSEGFSLLKSRTESDLSLKDYNRYKKDLLNDYKKNGIDISGLSDQELNDRVLEEAMSDLMGEIINDPETIRKIALEDKNLAERIMAYLGEFIDKIRSLFSENDVEIQSIVHNYEQLKAVYQEVVAQSDGKIDENTVFEGEANLSIEHIIGEKSDYGIGVVLDTDIFQDYKTRKWGIPLQDFVYNKLAGKELTAYDEKGNPEKIYVARKNDRVKKDGSNNNHKVIDKLARYKGDNIKALATVHLPEIVETAKIVDTNNENSHQWLDENGWRFYKSYVSDRNGKIYELILNVADGRDRKIAYDINQINEIDEKIRTTGGDVSSTDNRRDSLTSHSPYESMLPQNEDAVNSNNMQNDKANASGVKLSVRKGSRAEKAQTAMKNYEDTGNVAHLPSRSWAKEFDRASRNTEKMLENQIVTLEFEKRYAKTDEQKARLDKVLEDLRRKQEDNVANVRISGELIGKIEGSIERNYNLADIIDDLKDVDKGLKIRSGNYRFNDFYRNFERVFGKHFDKIKPLIDDFDNALGNEARYRVEKLAEEHSYIVKELGIKKGSKESKAVQWIAEGERNPDVKNKDDVEALRKMGITNIKILDPNLRVPYTEAMLRYEFGERAEAILQAERWYRRQYDEMINAINETQRRIYPNRPEKLLPKRKNYMRHFREVKTGFGGLIELMQSNNEIAPGLVSVSEHTSPKEKWASIKQRRADKATSEGAIEGFNEYIGQASYAIYVNPYIEKFRGLARDLAELKSAGSVMGANTETNEDISDNSSSTSTIPENANLSVGKGRRNQYRATWTIADGVLDNQDLRMFYDAVSRIHNRGSKNYQLSASGEYILDINNKLIYTDGNYDYPEIIKVISFESKYEDDTLYVKEEIYDAERTQSEIDNALEIIESTYGEGVFNVRKIEDSQTYEREIGRREGTYGSRTLGEIGKRRTLNKEDGDEPSFSMGKTSSQTQIRQVDNPDLNGFIEYLNDFANDLAGKMGGLDRAVIKSMGKSGRTTIKALQWFNNKTKANAVLANIASMSKQIMNIPNGVIYLQNPANILRGMADTCLGFVKNDTELEKAYKKSNFLTTRYADKAFDKFDPKGPKKFFATLLGAADEFGTRSIWNALYYEAMQYGESDPIRYADVNTRKAVAGRGIGEIPLAYKSQLAKLALPFQIEPTNSWNVMRDFINSNTPKGKLPNYADKGIKTAVFLLMTWGMNAALEALTGGKGSFDLLGDIIEGIMQGWKEEEDESTLSKTGTSAKRAIQNVAGDFIGSRSFGWTVGALLDAVDEDWATNYFNDSIFPSQGVNVPAIQSATKIGKKFADKDYLGAAMEGITSFAMPYGGKQLDKTIRGIADYARGGNYQSNIYKEISTGERGNMYYPIENGAGKLVKSAIFGPSSLKENKDYWDDKRLEGYKKAKASEALMEEKDEFIKAYKKAHPDSEVVRLYSDIKRKDVFPYEPIDTSGSYTIKKAKKEYTLSDSQKNHYQKLQNELMQKKYNEIFATSEYKNADGEEKRTLLAEARKEAKSKIRETIKTEHRYGRGVWR